MRKVFTRLVSYFLVPLTRTYLRKERSYTYRGTTVTVMPGVFHPGLFYSTRFLLRFITDQPLQGKTFLELGCGTGLIAIMASTMKASVTASDISMKAIENVERNALQNHAVLTVIHSDLFDKIPEQFFDWIVINPPYYLGKAGNESEMAWYCGEDFDYFRRLFPALKRYSHSLSTIVMVLTKGSEVKAITDIGKMHGVEFELIREKRVLFDERDYLFQLRVTSR